MDKINSSNHENEISLRHYLEKQIVDVEKNFNAQITSLKELVVGVTSSIAIARAEQEKALTAALIGQDKINTGSFAGAKDALASVVKTLTDVKEGFEKRVGILEGVNQRQRGVAEASHGFEDRRKWTFDKTLVILSLLISLAALAMMVSRGH